MTLNELDVVALTRERPEDVLPFAAVGTIVLVHNNGEAYIVEFGASNGTMIAVPTILAAGVRLATADDIARYRKQRPAAAE